MLGERPRKDYATFEHICPQEDGGDDSEANIVLACRKCNDVRGYHRFIDMRGLLKAKPSNQPGQVGQREVERTAA